jgi:glycosyltransferase involved in cell wall biosynthesis
MFLTICIPTYNREVTILRTLKSLEKEEFQDFEVIIVDDGSTDNTEKSIEQYKKDSKLNIRYLKKENGGKHSALNIGIEEAKGDFFWILDSDDWIKYGALKEMYNECMKIANNEDYSGIMGRCMTHEGTIIGKAFPNDPFISSYVDFHFLSGIKYGPFGDCCECNKTKIIKKYRFPEIEGTKFVPEAYIFDQIGAKYKLLCTNKVYRYTEYMEDGISNTIDYKDKNILGFLHHYVSRLENVFPYVSDISLKLKIIAWWRYWNSVKKDYNKKGPRVKKVSILGYLVYVLNPLINFTFNMCHIEIVKKGR